MPIELDDKVAERLLLEGVGRGSVTIVHALLSSGVSPYAYGGDALTDLAYTLKHHEIWEMLVRAQARCDLSRSAPDAKASDRPQP